MSVSFLSFSSCATFLSHPLPAARPIRIVKKNRERKIREKQEKVAAKPAPAAKPAITTVQDRRHLHNYRVIQRNLVYVIGLPGGLGSEDLLRKAEYFGQYGKIGKIVIHRNHSGASTRCV